jgi:hypothetical protein
MGLVIPKEELELGIAHGMHWTAYAVQTIALLAILFLAGLGGLLFWKFVGRSDTAPGQRVRSAGLGLVTAVAGTCFVWFLWYWNMVGYQF